MMYAWWCMYSYKLVTADELQRAAEPRVRVEARHGRKAAVARFPEVVTAPTVISIRRSVDAPFFHQSKGTLFFLLLNILFRYR